MSRLAVNGIELNVEDNGSGPALLLLHGFSGDLATWDFLLPHLQGFRVLRLDVIGHGKSQSPADPGRYGMDAAVADIEALLDALGVGSFAVVGYSMGGRLALHLALALRQRMWALVLESASPGIEDPSERAARARADDDLADSIERHGLETFVDRWQAQPLFASQARLPAAVREWERRRRLGQPARGLANSLRGMGAGRQEWLLPRLGELDMPALVLAGALDEKYAALAPVLAEAIPGARCEIVPQAGHAVHLERPEAFAASLTSFLREIAARELARRGEHDLLNITEE